MCNSGLVCRYPGSVFTDHVLRYQDTPRVKMIVVLGEVRNKSTNWRQHLYPVIDLQLPVSVSVLYRLEAQRSTRSARLLNRAGSQSQWSAGVLAPVPPCFPQRWEARVELGAFQALLGSYIRRLISGCLIRSSDPCCIFFCHRQVQFGHAGACANQDSETAVAKNKALKEAGAFVPKSFDELGEIIKSVPYSLFHFIILT